MKELARASVRMVKQDMHELGGPRAYDLTTDDMIEFWQFMIDGVHKTEVTDDTQGEFLAALLVEFERELAEVKAIPNN